MKTLSDIGLVGLAVMGENLTLNMDSTGYTVTAVTALLSRKGRRRMYLSTHRSTAW